MDDGPVDRSRNDRWGRVLACRASAFFYLSFSLFLPLHVAMIRRDVQGSLEGAQQAVTNAPSCDPCVTICDL